MRASSGRGAAHSWSVACCSVQFQTALQCRTRTKSGRPCWSPATRKGCCRLHGGAKGSGGPPGERNGQFRHGERTKAAIAEQQKFSALLKMLRAGLTRARKVEKGVVC